jgi:hypothetical protein
MSQESSNPPESLATMTTAHELSSEKLELYNIFKAARKQTWEENINEDKKIRDIFYQVGKYQADQAVGKVEAFLYNKETESDILDAVMSEKEKEEQLYTKDELRETIRKIMEKTTPMTEEEIKEFQDAEAERYKKIVERENGKF